MNNPAIIPDEKHEIGTAVPDRFKDWTFYQEIQQIPQELIQFVINSELYYDKGYGYYSDALSEIDKFLIKHYQCSYAHILKGLTLYKMGKYQEAYYEERRAVIQACEYKMGYYPRVNSSFYYDSDLLPDVTRYISETTKKIVNKYGKNPPFRTDSDYTWNDLMEAFNIATNYYNEGNFEEIFKKYAETICRYNFVNIDFSKLLKKVKKDIKQIVGESGIPDNAEKNVESQPITETKIPAENTVNTLSSDVPTGNSPDEFYLKEGFVHSQAGDYACAIAKYSKAIEINNDNIRAHILKGFALCQLGDYEEGIHEYEITLWLDPNNAEAHNNLGMALFTIGYPEKAIEEFDTALRIYPEYTDAILNKGFVLDELGEHKMAVKQYDKIIAVNPRDCCAYFNKGQSLTSMMRFSESIVEYDKSIEIRPDDSFTRFSKGFSLYSLERYEEAIAEFKIAISLDDTYPEIYYYLALSLLSVGEYRESLESLNKFKKIYPFNPDIYYNKGIAYEKLGEYSNALAEYEIALTIDRDNKSYHLAKEKLLFVLHDGDMFRSGYRSSPISLYLFNYKEY